MSENARRSSADKNDGPKKLRRRTAHVSKACNGCRRRKMKCDGAQPTCAICKVYKEECVYNPDRDGRRSTSKAYVAALEERVRVLNEVVKDLAIKGSVSPHGLESVKSSLARPEGDSALPENTRLERLKMDGTTGELFEYGPTSPFIHMPEGSEDMSPGADTAGPSPTGTASVTGHERPAQLYPNNSPVPELSAPEMDDDMHEQVLWRFFDYFNPQSLWVDEKRFRRDMLASPVVEGTIIRRGRTAYYSPLLHNAVLAIGVALLELPINADERSRLGTAFSTRAKDLVDDEIETATLSTVGGALLLGTYFASIARHNKGFVYTGIGLRLVQALGLGTNCSYWVSNDSITEETKQARYNMYFTAYILDKCWSTYLGRPATLSFSNHDIPIPVPNAEIDELMWKPTIHPQSPETSGFDPQISQAAVELSDTIAAASPKPVKGWRSTTWVWTIRLCLIAERVLGTVYSIRFNTSSSSVRHVVSELDMLLEKWLDSLPDELRLPASGRAVEGVVPSHILTLHAFHCFMLILLHRPWFAEQDSRESRESRASSSADQQSGSELSVSKCECAAAKVLAILGIWRRCPGLRYSPVTTGQITFSAGTVYLLSSRRARWGSRKFQTSLEAVHECIVALREMGYTFKCADVSANTLQDLLDEAYGVPRPKLARAQKQSLRGIDIASMLQNPDVANQLLQLGWMRPSAASTSIPSVTGTDTSHASPPGMPISNASPNANANADISSDNANAGLIVKSASTATATATANHSPVSDTDWLFMGQPRLECQSPMVPPLPVAANMPPPTAGHTDSEGGDQSIYELLFPGALRPTLDPALPSCNVWPWLFGSTDGAGVGL